MTKRRVVTYEQSLEMYNAIGNGGTTASVSKDYQIGLSTMYEWFHFYGFKTNRNKNNKVDEEKLFEMYQSGMTLLDIERQTGIPENTLSRRLHQAGYKLRRRGHEKKLPNCLSDKEFLSYQYNDLQKPMSVIAKDLGVSQSSVVVAVRDLGITKRDHGETLRLAFQNHYCEPLYGQDHPNFGVSPSHGKGTWVEHNQQKYFLRSSYELTLFNYLVENQYDFTYEEIRFNLGDCTYLPDFFIYDRKGNLQCIVEVKGWIKEKDIRKHLLFEALYPEIPLVLIAKEEIKQLRKEAA